MRLIFALLLMLMALAPSAVAQTDPLTGRTTQAEPRARPPRPDPWRACGALAITLQRDLVERMARHVREMRDGTSLAGLFIGIGVGLLYGILHTLGPGHGKFAVASYFLSQGATVRRGALMGAQVAVTHVIAAVVLVAIADITVRDDHERPGGGAAADAAAGLRHPGADRALHAGDGAARGVHTVRRMRMIAATTTGITITTTATITAMRHAHSQQGLVGDRRRPGAVHRLDHGDAVRARQRRAVGGHRDGRPPSPPAWR